MGPHWYVGIGVTVTNKIHTMLSATEQYVDTVGSLEEPHLLGVVASNQGDNDDLGLFALEIVDRSNT